MQTKKRMPEQLEMLKGYSDQIAEVKNTSAGATAVAELLNPRLSDAGGVIM